MEDYTIYYRGWQIDPVAEDDDDNLMPCASVYATLYLIFPPDDGFSMDEWPSRLSRLDRAMAVVDRYIEKEAAA